MKKESQESNELDNTALAKLLNKIKKEAEEEAELIRREAKKKLEDIEKETKKLEDDIKRQELDKETSRLDFIRKRTETEYQQKAKKIMIQSRENLIDQVFEQVEKEILSFRDNKQYPDYLNNLLISTTKKITANKIKIIGDKKDKDILKEITSKITNKEGTKFNIITSTLKTLGGFIITDEDERVRINYTIENVLKVSRERIRTRINEILFT